MESEPSERDEYYTLRPKPDVRCELHRGWLGGITGTVAAPAKAESHSLSKLMSPARFPKAATKQQGALPYMWVEWNTGLGFFFFFF